MFNPVITDGRLLLATISMLVLFVIPVYVYWRYFEANKSYYELEDRLAAIFYAWGIMVFISVSAIMAILFVLIMTPLFIYRLTEEGKDAFSLISRCLIFTIPIWAIFDNMMLDQVGLHNIQQIIVTLFY